MVAVSVCASVLGSDPKPIVAKVCCELPRCYGRLAVVSDVDNEGFALNVDKELRGSAMLYRSKYNGAMLGSRWT
jgi:hypothetical protein